VRFFLDHPVLVLCTNTSSRLICQILIGRDAGLQWRIFLKYAELFEAKYVGKYIELGEICGIYMRHIGH